MPQFRASAGGLRIVGRRGRSFKFRGGKFATGSEADAHEIRTFAYIHPEYGIVEEGDAPTGVEMSAEVVAEIFHDKRPVPPPPPQAVELVTVADPLEDFEGMLVPELRELAHQRGMKTGGSKRILLARLRGKE